MFNARMYRYTANPTVLPKRRIDSQSHRVAEVLCAAAFVAKIAACLMAPTCSTAFFGMSVEVIGRLLAFLCTVTGLKGIHRPESSQRVSKVLEAAIERL